jgi:hypothetical protein
MPPGNSTSFKRNKNSDHRTKPTGFPDSLKVKCKKWSQALFAYPIQRTNSRLNQHLRWIKPPIIISALLGQIIQPTRPPLLTPLPNGRNFRKGVSLIDDDVNECQPTADSEVAGSAKERKI